MNLESGVRIIKKGLLNRPVITCREAAFEKRIPLKNELKSLILETSLGVRAIHIPGNRKVSLRIVKDFLSCEDARLASAAILSSLNIFPGRICMFIPPVWEMNHLICYSVFSREYLSTNDGTSTGYIIFRPNDLLKAKRKDMGNFSTKDK